MIEQKTKQSAKNARPEELKSPTTSLTRRAGVARSPVPLFYPINGGRWKLIIERKDTISKDTQISYI